jgi:hypothetical protein
MDVSKRHFRKKIQCSLSRQHVNIYNYLIDFSYILYMIMEWHIELKIVDVLAKSGNDDYLFN